MKTRTKSIQRDRRKDAIQESGSPLDKPWPQSVVSSKAEETPESRSAFQSVLYLLCIVLCMHSVRLPSFIEENAIASTTHSMRQIRPCILCTQSRTYSWDTRRWHEKEWEGVSSDCTATRVVASTKTHILYASPFSSLPTVAPANYTVLEIAGWHLGNRIPWHPLIYLRTIQGSVRTNCHLVSDMSCNHCHWTKWSRQKHPTPAVLVYSRVVIMSLFKCFCYLLTIQLTT